MIVVQIFVMKNGAFQGVEMACGDALLVGPPGADVPLADVSGCGVQLMLDGDALIAEPVGDGVRVDGERLLGAAVLTAQTDVTIGSYTLKFRRQSAPRRAPAPIALAATDAAAHTASLRTAPESIATVPELRARASDDEGRAIATHAGSGSQSGAHDRPQDGAPEERAWWLGYDGPVDDGDDDIDIDGVIDGDDTDVPWSLVQALARAAPDAGARLVEVVHVRGERVIDHAFLDARARYAVGGQDLVRRRADGTCVLTVPRGGALRVLRAPYALHGEQRGTEDVFARDAALSITLARGDAANLRVGDDQLLVRFASMPALAPSAEERLLQRAEQRMQAACAGVGMSLCTLWGGATWLLEYRDREIVLSLDDDDVTQWQDVALVMTPPPPEPPPPEPVAAPEPDAGAPATPAKAARGSRHKESPPAVTARRPLDVLKSLPTLETNRALDLALTNVRAPLPSRPGGPILQPMAGRGRGGDLAIGGSGLDTGAAAKGLKEGAGGLGAREARAIGGGVARAKLRNLTASSEQGLSKDEILRVINAHIGEIQVCYEKGLRGDAKLGGRVEVEWVINPVGRVVRARLETSSLPSDAVVRCMLDRIETWRFPRAKTPSVVSYPFSFAAL